jgi:hypothetical protein
MAFVLVVLFVKGQATLSAAYLLRLCPLLILILIIITTITFQRWKKYSLRQMDLEMMRRLHKKVNIVIVITKADTLTQSEVKRLKANILRDVEANGIQLYKFPECESDEDDDFKRQDAEMKQSIPFAVVGSNTIFEVGGKKFRGRQYPWGVVDGERFLKLFMPICLTQLFFSFKQLKIHSTATSLNSARC